jgi:hypothetical protein
VDVLLVGGSREECSNDVNVSHVGQLSALPGEASNVLMESLIRLLVAAFGVPGITRVDISALEVPYENLYEVGLVVDAAT